MGLHLLIELLFPSVLSGEVKPVLDYGWCDWWDIFWAREPSEPGGMPMPINYPLWFIPVSYTHLDVYKRQRNRWR